MCESRAARGPQKRDLPKRSDLFDLRKFDLAKNLGAFAKIYEYWGKRSVQRSQDLDGRVEARHCSRLVADRRLCLGETRNYACAPPLVLRLIGISEGGFLNKVHDGFGVGVANTTVPRREKRVVGQLCSKKLGSLFSSGR